MIKTGRRRKGTDRRKIALKMLTNHLGIEEEVGLPVGKVKGDVQKLRIAEQTALSEASLLPNCVSTLH